MGGLGMARECIWADRTRVHFAGDERSRLQEESGVNIRFG